MTLPIFYICEQWKTCRYINSDCAGSYAHIRLRCNYCKDGKGLVEIEEFSKLQWLILLKNKDKFYLDKD
jgi:hypothetical protein